MKIGKGLFAKYSVISHTFGNGIKDLIAQSEAPELSKAIQMAKESFIEDFDKLDYEVNYIIIELEQSNDKVTIEKYKEYSDDFKESSKTYKTYLRTYGHKQDRIIISNVKVFKNPAYDENPECEFCFKKVVEVFKDHLLNEVKTEKMVCSSCKKYLAKMRKILLKINEEKK